MYWIDEEIERELNKEVTRSWIKEIEKIEDIDWLEENNYTRGIEWFPEFIGKFADRDLVVLAWYPSSWKTEFTYFLAQKNAKQDVKTLYISLELKPQDLLLRLSRKRAGVSKLQYQNKSLSDYQADLITQKYDELRNLKNLKVISYSWSPTVDILEKTICEYEQEWYKLFFIDNLWKIDWDSNENIRFEDITSKLQNLKNNKNICIWLLHHLSKPSKQSQYNPWWIASFRWSQKIIDNASLVFEIHRNQDPEANELEKSEVWLYLYKDTMDWATGKADLVFKNWDYEIRRNINL